MNRIEVGALSYAHEASELCLHPDKTPIHRVFVQTIVRDETYNRSNNKNRYRILCFYCRKTMEKTERLMNGELNSLYSPVGNAPPINRTLSSIHEEEEEEDLPELERV